MRSVERTVLSKLLYNSRMPIYTVYYSIGSKSITEYERSRVMVVLGAFKNAPELNWSLGGFNDSTRGQYYEMWMTSHMSEWINTAGGR